MISPVILCNCQHLWICARLISQCDFQFADCRFEYRKYGLTTVRLAPYSYAMLGVQEPLTQARRATLTLAYRDPISGQRR